MPCAAYELGRRVTLVRRTTVRISAVVILILAVAGAIEYRRDRQVREALYAAVTPIQITNCELRRFGDRHDGGYLMCANLLQRSQAAYSYGIEGTDAWGCDVAGPLNIPLHQYGCGNTSAPPCSGGNAAQFHAECIGPERATIEGRAFDTIANQIVTNGDTGKRLVVKMAVDGAEWQSLAAAPDYVLEAIDQLAIEFHGVENRAHLDIVTRLTQFFYVAHYHHNNFECRSGFEPFAGPVFEVLLVNKRMAVANPWATARGGLPIDSPNNPNAADCQAEAQRSEPNRIARWLIRKARGAAQLLIFSGR